MMQRPYAAYGRKLFILFILLFHIFLDIHDRSPVQKKQRSSPIFRANQPPVEETVVRLGWLHLEWRMASIVNVKENGIQKIQNAESE